MADACVPLGIDPYEVCSAAATKPFGYMPYTPGIGVGGHCIPVNPFYLLSNSSFPLLEAATKQMWSRPAALADRTLASLRQGDRASPEDTQKRRKGMHRVLVVGMAFKAGQSSLSNSPGLELAKQLAVSREVEVSWADAMVNQEAIPQLPRLPDSEWRTETLETFNLIIVALRQRNMDFGVLEDLKDVRVDMWCQ
jgi:UDP-N-acetyl-D-mannosaminuronate dehydrogenase